MGERRGEIKLKYAGSRCGDRCEKLLSWLMMLPLCTAVTGYEGIYNTLIPYVEVCFTDLIVQRAKSDSPAARHPAFVLSVSPGLRLLRNSDHNHFAKLSTFRRARS